VTSDFGPSMDEDSAISFDKRQGCVKDAYGKCTHNIIHIGKRDEGCVTRNCPIF